MQKMMKEFLHKAIRFTSRLLNWIFNRFGIVISKPDFVHGSPAFSGALVFSRRLFQTKMHLDQVKDVDGDIVEGGIHWGYGLLIELLLSNKKVHAFDSFSGHSKATVFDRDSKAWKPLDSAFEVGLEDVKKTLDYGSTLSIEDVEARVAFYDGWVQDTMPQWSKTMASQGKYIAYVHADMDIYEPIKVILTQTYPLLSKGAIVVVGVIDNPELMGKTKAFKEFLSEIDESEIEIKTRIMIGTGGGEQTQTYFVKN